MVLWGNIVFLTVKTIIQCKGGKAMKGKMLEDMAEWGHCFISDLRHSSSSNLNSELFRKFPFDQYSLEECSYCFSYIFDQPFAFKQWSEVNTVIQDLPWME